jgi:hypothetical protein
MSAGITGTAAGAAFFTGVLLFFSLATFSVVISLFFFTGTIVVF